MDIRYRYNKRKNTLATIREGDVVFFGISKCHVKMGDVFDKNRGRTIALGRADLEHATVEIDNDPNISLRLHDSQLRGHCGVNNVKELVRYFDDVDRNFYRHNGPLNPKIADRLQKLSGIMGDEAYDENCHPCSGCSIYACKVGNENEGE